MKQTINYFYKIDVDTVSENGNIYYFILDKFKYYFVPLCREEKELNEIIEVSKELKNCGIKCHDIIINKFNKVISPIGEQKYILLRICDDSKKEISIFDLINVNRKLRVSNQTRALYKNNWEELWSKKIDYFEYQIRNYGKNKSGILNTFSYYLGMAETAVIYVSKTMTEYPLNEQIDEVTLNHRRVFFPNYQLNFFNPLSFIFDLEVRDYAEYFKSAFFAGEDIKTEFSSFLKAKKFGAHSYHMFYARLIFPSYYFDVYEKIIHEETSEDDLINIVKRNKDYEQFLTYAYFEINKYYPLKKIEWLVK